ncbi:MAG TPA: bifunctional UDP-3-O-[3-hydroxymyristoyl] N-acetylglucosamine deacetylase/3-hydroxyacyl-ACP dehydratase [Candidatus Baltobacteraceae bacterium]|jgi:UDP-3-O-[3-hydroxymyristoyl] N-acetylglucosamine deacetylase / 3-hydroxyacyl-[acyl-carrier-protein] dehydratase|nr:bifunctional UDP-3-O-[3-hydroxymyristoyl] N-acetylglucosamine deacetylase/3-hydroxyacyl-ACP dehydratase [Candidatus Baltobacteraceae bacterium]
MSLPSPGAIALMPSVLHQQTLRQAASFSGVGLHSGNRVNMTFLPAPPGSGVRFRRVDLEGSPEIEARVEYVSTTNRSTSLSKGNAKIHTVEHVLAALAGSGIDNAVIELDANEPPIADGSARQYVKMIKSAGAAPQDEPREVFYVQSPVSYQKEETSISVFPHEGFKISCTSADAKGRFTQFFSVDVTPDTWERDLADARTFCFFEEIEFLIKNGLIKGGSLENAVVIRDDAILTTEPLRYREEFVRHKILDIIGDLSLVGRPIAGHVIAVKPSHNANCEVARQLWQQLRKPIEAAGSFTPPAQAGKSEGDAVAIRDGDELDTERLMKILPHRYPFLMVDKIIKIDGSKIVGIKNVTANEPFFQGHFPGRPIMPGVLQLEAIAQVAGVLMLRQAENFGKLAYFMSAESVRWRKPVRPGDTLVIDVELTKSRGKIGKAKGTCLVNGETVSEAEVTFMLIDR